MTREQAREIDTGIGRLEIEFSQTVKKTMSRRQELKDITEGLDRMMELKRERQDRMVAIDQFLEFQRKYLPPAAAAGISIQENGFRGLHCYALLHRAMAKAVLQNCLDIG